MSFKYRVSKIDQESKEVFQRFLDDPNTENTREAAQITSLDNDQITDLFKTKTGDPEGKKLNIYNQIIQIFNYYSEGYNKSNFIKGVNQIFTCLYNKNFI